MKQLPEMSVVELNKEEKLTKTLVGAWIGSLLVMVVISGLWTFQKGFTFWTVMPVFFLPLALSSFDRLKKLRAELNSRT